MQQCLIQRYFTEMRALIEDQAAFPKAGSTEIAPQQDRGPSGRRSYRKRSTPYCARRASSLRRSSTLVDRVAISNGRSYASLACECSKS